MARRRRGPVGPCSWRAAGGCGRSLSGFSSVRSPVAVFVFSGLTAFHGFQGLTLSEAFIGSYDDIALFGHCPGNAETLRDFVGRGARENALFRLAEGIEDGAHEQLCIEARVTLPSLEDASRSVPDGLPDWLADGRRLERAVQEAVNAYRRARGLDPMRYRDDVAVVAREHSENMAQLGFFGHVDQLGRGPAARFPSSSLHCGENLIQIPRAVASTRVLGVTLWRERDLFRMSSPRVAELLVQGWAASPGHEEQMRFPTLNVGGVGAFYEEEGGLYVTHNLCRQE